MAPKRKAEATRWFQQAAYDLKAARWNVQGGFHDTACFLSQQAGEKALKSLLYYVGGRRVALLTHSLVEMITHAGKQVGSLTELPSTTSPRGTRMACPAATRTPSTDRRPRRKPSRRPNGSSTPSHTTTGAPASTASSNRPKGGNPSVLHARSQRAAADSFSHASGATVSIGPNLASSGARTCAPWPTTTIATRSGGGMWSRATRWTSAGVTAATRRRNVASSSTGSP
ncbi:MAG: HEPN domain-containing protein [Deltaproteobacteria bacterium]|nr:MAG: HEPN domain-containing protein [Deltaproteobacteria bacterium]